MNFPPLALTHAPPRFPCTSCHVSHGGCCARWIASAQPCCDICDHQPGRNER